MSIHPLINAFRRQQRQMPITNPLQSYRTGCDAKAGSSDSEDLENACLPLQAGEIWLVKILNVPQVHESHAIEVALVRQNLEHHTDYIAVSYAWVLRN